MPRYLAEVDQAAKRGVASPGKDVQPSGAMFGQSFFALA